MNTETSVLVVWPKRMAPEHYKAMHSGIVSMYLNEEMIGQLVPTFPRAANRYGINFPTHAAAASFLEKSRTKAFEYDLKESGEHIKLRAQWPTSSDQQARGALFKGIYDAIDQGELAGLLRLSYPKGPRPKTIVSVMLCDGSLEEIATVVFSDFSDDPWVIGVTPGERLAGNAPMLTEVRRAAGLAAAPSPQTPTAAGAAAQPGTQWPNARCARTLARRGHATFQRFNSLS